MSYSNKYGKCSDRWQGCVLRKDTFSLFEKVLDEQTLGSEIQRGFIPCFSMWRYWVSVWPYLYYLGWSSSRWWAEEALNGNWERALAWLSYFLEMYRAFLCPGRDEWVIVFMRSRDSGPAYPHYSGWNGGHHRAKEEWMCLEVLAKDLWGPVWYRAVILHLLNGSFDPEHWAS